MPPEPDPTVTTENPYAPVGEAPAPSAAPVELLKTYDPFETIRPIRQIAAQKRDAARSARAFAAKEHADLEAAQNALVQAHATAAAMIAQAQGAVDRARAADAAARISEMIAAAEAEQAALALEDAIDTVDDGTQLEDASAQIDHALRPRELKVRLKFERAMPTIGPTDPPTKGGGG